MFIAITTGSSVLEISSNEASSLEAMSHYANTGHKNLRRIITDAAAFILYGSGAQLETDLLIEDGKAATIIKVVTNDCPDCGDVECEFCGTNAEVF